MPKRMIFLGSLMLGLLGCGADGVAPEPVYDSEDLYWSLTLNERAINLATAAPYDTFRLVATPRTADGRALDGLPAATFTSTDPDRVAVSPDGVIHALRSTNRVKILATLRAGNLTYSDSAFVRVTAGAPPAVARLALEPDPADSAKWTVHPGLHYPPAAIAARALDAVDNVVPLSIWIESSEPQVAWFDNAAGQLQVRDRGSVTFYASTVAYGVVLRDTLEYTLGLPVYGCIRMVKQQALGSPTPTYSFLPSTVTVGVGAYVWWSGLCGIAGEDFDVTFDDPTHVAEDLIFCNCGSGDIPTFDPPPLPGEPTFRTRYFPVPGTYTYRSAKLGISGTIIVVDESQSAAASASRRRLAAVLDRRRPPSPAS